MWKETADSCRWWEHRNSLRNSGFQIILTTTCMPPWQWDLSTFRSTGISPQNTYISVYKGNSTGIVQLSQWIKTIFFYPEQLIWTAMYGHHCVFILSFLQEGRSWKNNIKNNKFVVAIILSLTAVAIITNSTVRSWHSSTQNLTKVSKIPRPLNVQFTFFISLVCLLETKIIT